MFIKESRSDKLLFYVIVRQAFGSGEDVREPVSKFLLLCVEFAKDKKREKLLKPRLLPRGLERQIRNLFFRGNLTDIRDHRALF
jgi:hypothetical protein